MVCCWDESVFRKVFWREEKMSALFQISRAFFRQKSKSEAFRSKNDRYLLIFYHGSFIFLILGFGAPSEVFSSNERELAIDESVPQSNAVPSLQFVPDLDVIIREGEECVRRALEQVEASDSRTEEASEGDSFVDIMAGLEKENGGESEGFTFADIMQRADLLSETVLEGLVATPDLPLC